jgi:hypothetical protein
MGSSDFKNLKTWLLAYFSQAARDVYTRPARQNSSTMIVFIPNPEYTYKNIQHHCWTFNPEDVNNDGVSTGALIGTNKMTTINGYTGLGVISNSVTRSADSSEKSIKQYTERLAYYTASSIYDAVNKVNPNINGSRYQVTLTTAAVKDINPNIDEMKYQNTLNNAGGGFGSTTTSYDGSSSTLAVVDYSGGLLATDPIEINNIKYYVITFTTTGNITFSYVNTSFDIIVEMVAGGGGGGGGGTGGTGGGGGGGGEYYYSNYQITSSYNKEELSITVGTGGAGGTSDSNGNGSDGTSSSFGPSSTNDSIPTVTVAYGYGGSVGTSTSGGNGGNGGGGTGGDGCPGAISITTQCTTNSGTMTTNNNRCGGGGGGGGAYDFSTGGGSTSSGPIGFSTYPFSGIYGGGGGGGVVGYSDDNTGASGGGTGAYGETDAEDATGNGGGGGGGADGSSGNTKGGNGGDGIVIIYIPTKSTQEPTQSS